jgi:energy-coupling factor transporter ATP-binding protein EcfA2
MFPQNVTKNTTTLLNEPDREIRLIGRNINYGGTIEHLLQIVNQSVNNDIYNDLGMYNIYRRQVTLLETYLSPYIDKEYSEQFTFLETDHNTTMSVERKSCILDQRMNLCLMLLKRKGFIPADDVETNSSVIVQRIKNHIKKEFDALIKVTGPRGTGKSTLAMQLAKEIAKDQELEWDITKHLFFHPIDLRNYIYNEKPKRGQPIIWDEAGAGKGMGRRRAMTTESIEFNEIIQVIREMGLVIFYTCPTEDNLDSGTVGMFSHAIETIKIDRSNMTNIVKFKIRDGAYFVYPRSFDGNRITKVIIEKLDDRIISIYKKMKKVFMYEKVKVTEKEKKEREIVDIIKVVDELEKKGELKRLLGPRGGIDQLAVETETGFGGTVSRRISSEIRRRVNEKKD